MINTATIEMDLTAVTTALQHWNQDRTDATKGVNLLRAGQFMDITRTQYETHWKTISENDFLHVYIGVDNDSPVFYAIDSVSDSVPFKPSNASKIVAIEFYSELQKTMPPPSFIHFIKGLTPANDDSLTHHEAWKRGFRWLMFSSIWFEDEKAKRIENKSNETGVVRVIKVPMKDLHDLFDNPDNNNVGMFFGLDISREEGTEEETVFVELILTSVVDNYPHHKLNLLADVTTPFPPFSSSIDYAQFGLLNYSDTL